MTKMPASLLPRLLDSLRDFFILVLDQEQRIVYANTAFLDHFGVGEQEVLGRRCFDLVSPFEGPEASGADFCPELPGPPFPYRTTLTREIKGKQSFFEGTFYSLSDSAQASWAVGVFQDVTENFQMRSEVRHLFELERKLVQASIDGIIVNDLEGNVLIYNEGASRILGYRPEEVIGKFKADKFYPPHLAHEIKEKIYQPGYGGVGILENFETVAYHQDGTLVPIWLSARVLYEEGREVGIVGYFRDLRERKRLEEDLLRHERLATLGKMMAHITHEIKNPLLLIGGFSQQLERLREIPVEARRKLKLIHEEVRRLEKFLADLGAFTRITQCRKVPGDLLALVREVAEFMETGFKDKTVLFELQAPAGVPTFPFDSGQIRQVLINVFKNALEAMEPGGRLTVGVAVQAGYLILTVTDTGHGIAPEHLQNLFTPFFSTKEQGSGLGLTICRGLIEQHRGEISIDSEVGRGTTCTIRLPLTSS
jgi:PAS domain S-box-containing protein